MSDLLKDLAVPLGIVLSIMAIIGTLLGATAYFQSMNDEYCRTIPVERMDKERCGVEL